VDGDRKAYEEAVDEASDCVERREWEQAIVAYQRALAEFPEDAVALAGLGLALSEEGRLEEALDAYRKAAGVDTEDPALLEHAAQILKQLGRNREAARAYQRAAELHERLEAPALAMERWRDAVEADSSYVPAHVSLLQAYLAERKNREAVGEYLALADIYETRGQDERALELCQCAAQLDPNNPQLLTRLEHLRSGEHPAPASRPPDTSSLEFPVRREGEKGDRGSPADIARHKALSDLAEAVFDETPPKTGPLILRPISKQEVDNLISRALDAQTLGDVKQAIACYERVLRGGVIQPAVNFNLGLLYQDQLRFEAAIEQFEESVSDPEYRLGSNFAMGECCRALGRIEEALTHFIEVLKLVDLGTVRREQADDVIHLYEELARTYAAKGENEQAVEFANTLISFLSEKGWEDKAVQARGQLDTLAREGPVLSLAEILAVPGSERVLQSIGLAQEYQRRGMGYAAVDELSRAILVNPTFLPLHRQMGEALVGMGKTDQAVDKFLAIADVYRVRGGYSQAAAMYERALNLEPMNVVVRARLIDLLVSHGEIDRALDQYLILGDTYYRMAQLERAREKFSEALRLAPRGSVEHRWAVRILHRIGDIDMQRVDWRQAIRAYERICELEPDDEKARLTLVNLYSRLDQPARAIAELDGLLRALRESGKTEKIITVLEDAIQEQPDDIPLHTRLAQAYLDAREVEKALLELDTLGDLQLEAGRTQEAITTIQTILRLNPPNPDAYRRLLEQLMAGQGGSEP
jgi:tetratricopeptide (TPR) repeat protein